MNFVNLPGIELQKQQRVRPPWVEDLLTFYNGRIARQFVLHFNITDYIIDLDQKRDSGKGKYIRAGNMLEDTSQAPQTLREYLYQFLFDELSCQYIYTYSLANGLTADDVTQQIQEKKNGSTGRDVQSEQSSPAMQHLQNIYKSMRALPQRGKRATDTQDDELQLPTDISENFKLLTRVLRMQLKGSDPLNPHQERETPVAVVLDYAEKLIPYHLGEGQGDREQLQALEVVQRWALDPQIRQLKNIIILLTTNIGQIPSSVYAEGSGCRALRVPLPDENEREAFLRFKMTSAHPRLVPMNQAEFGLIETVQANRLARATQGMRLTDIDNMSRRVASEFQKRRNDPLIVDATQEIAPMLRLEHVQQVKAEVIQAQSADLLEIVPPTRSFSEIGGLNNLKKYLRQRAQIMLSGQQSPLVPGGLLLAGPPGTGKTIIAEALATESGFNLVKMRSIQDKWVGSSERNLELVLNLLKDLHPVVVFIDEIDQAISRRDTGQSGDSGVGARMFARLLEEMSNPLNRGRILWVAATNRADIIDEAMLRRFDRVVPLLTPDVEESCRIFAAMMHIIVKHSANTLRVRYGGDLVQQSAADERGHLSPTRSDLEKFLPEAQQTVELGITGAGIEIIVRRAIEIVYEELAEKQIALRPDDIPAVESRHLHQAVQDYKPNHNRAVYDYQSLLAIRACNFQSVLPTLPKTGVFARIQRADGMVDSEKLEQEILVMERQQLLKR
jgi:transitional endoplasmic reticulum ATPase